MFLLSSIVALFSYRTISIDVWVNSMEIRNILVWILIATFEQILLFSV